MNKKEYIRAISKKVGVKKDDIKKIMECAYEVLCENVIKEPIKIFDGITIETVEKDACRRRNPQNGETVDVPAKRVPRVKFGVTFKKAVDYK